MSVDISAPVQNVFNYYARPEHIAKTFPEDVKMKVIPIKVTEGFGVGTVFRIEGEFGGRPLAWDMETVAYENNKVIQVSALNGPFKRNVITVGFEPIATGTKLTFEADYDIGYSLLGKAIDKLKLKKEIEMGIERSCASVKRFIEAGKSPNDMGSELRAQAA
ncbi:MAG: SRPBCC family protein [Thaumarchaeota archaeon]|nr:SRPBCC family protein [Nitrososphaerota archaeon]